jgi:hypothetical protein
MFPQHLAVVLVALEQRRMNIVMMELVLGLRIRQEATFQQPGIHW